MTNKDYTPEEIQQKLAEIKKWREQGSQGMWLAVPWKGTHGAAEKGYDHCWTVQAPDPEDGQYDILLGWAKKYEGINKADAEFIAAAANSLLPITDYYKRQLAERDAEIERLKIDNEFLYSFVSCGTKYQIANHFRHKEPKP